MYLIQQGHLARKATKFVATFAVSYSSQLTLLECFAVPCGMHDRQWLCKSDLKGGCEAIKDEVVQHEGPPKQA